MSSTPFSFLSTLDCTEPSSVEWYSLHRSLTPPLSVPSTYHTSCFPPIRKYTNTPYPPSLHFYTQLVVSATSDILSSLPATLPTALKIDFSIFPPRYLQLRLSSLPSYSLPHFHRTRKVNRPTPLPPHIRLSFSRSPSFGLSSFIRTVQRLASFPSSNLFAPSTDILLKTNRTRIESGGAEASGSGGKGFLSSSILVFGVLLISLL